jgi:O-antigen ligase
MKVEGESVASVRGRAWNLLLRVVPLAVIAVAVSYVLGKQVVQPHHRMIKAGLLLLVLVILLRFEMVYSIYFFILMFPFPSGLVLTSTNVILMTMIPLIWLARSRAAGERFFARTEIDRWVIVLIFAYLVSFFNVETTALFVGGLKMVWRQLAALALFYLIVTFVTDEKQLERITKVMAVSGGVVALTGLVELVSPGATLIPGWIQTAQRMGQGELGYRVQGIRLGGAVGSHEILSDYSGLCLWFVITHFLRARNPIEKLLWLGISAVSLISILATANRGAVVAIGVAFLYALWVFRRKFNLVKYVILISAVIVTFAAAQLVLDKYTVAASVTDRLTGTQFEGITPDSRVGVWGPVFQSCLDHIFIGHGPWYDTGRGLVRVYWPHNGFLYYLHTLGLFGLAAFVVILIKIYRITLRYSHPAASTGFVGVALSVTGVQLAQLVVAQMRTDHQRTTDSIYMFIVWLVFGLVAASGNVLRRKERELSAAAAEEAGPPPLAWPPADPDGAVRR